MMMMKNGYYTALGTPINSNGQVLHDSLAAEIECQILAETSGLLLLGSMGLQSCIKMSEIRGMIRTASSVVKGRVPLLVGVMDNSLARIKDRLDLIENSSVNGVVLTAPYYEVYSDNEIVEFYNRVAQISPYPVYLYDLPSVTQTKITYDMITHMNHDKIKGIKTGNLLLIKQLKLGLPDFDAFYSNLDLFDVANAYGIHCVLDGMFSCTPVNNKRMKDCFLIGDIGGGTRYLQNIIDLRDLFVQVGVMRGFSAAMNLLGFAGSFQEDFSKNPDEETIHIIRKHMKQIDEIS